LNTIWWATWIAIWPPTQFDSNTRLLCEISDIYGLQQLITEPARITESLSSLNRCNIYKLVDCLRVLHVGISDHSLIYVIVNYLRSLLSKGILLKLTEIFVILIVKTFAAILLDRIGPVPVMTQTPCAQTGKLNFWLLWTVTFQSKQNVLGHARYLRSHLTCGWVFVIVILLNGKPLSLKILKTGLYTEDYVIESMERLNLPRHPTRRMRLYSPMATQEKRSKWLTNSRPVRKVTRLWKN